MIIIDFETHAIDGATSFNPPQPIGVSIRDCKSGRARYMGWGHKQGNNCSMGEAKAALTDIWKSGQTLGFHNAPFDLSVIERWFDLPWPHYTRYHDSMVLAYLYDPQVASLSLKPLANLYLGMKPEEQDEVRQWLLDHNIVTRTQKDWGKHISEVPLKIVAPYANGDTLRTDKLIEYLGPKIVEGGMHVAYQRELCLQRHLHDATKRGIRVDREGMMKQLETMSVALKVADELIRVELNAPGLNVDANTDLADALDHAKAVKQWAYTATGQRSTAREALIQGLHDPALAHLLAYRGTVATIVGTFLEPWLDLSAKDGRLHPEWNSIRGDYGRGTRTGRLSCSHPNLQNPPKEFTMSPPAGLPVLPNLREFILPEKGEVFVSADFHSQEIRILGHFAEGAIQAIYRADPKADVHSVIQKMVTERTGVQLERKPIKVILFSLLYGAGVGLISKRLGVPESEATKMIEAILDTLTGVKSLRFDVQNRARSGQTVTTWGGRKVRAPAGPDGTRRDYALLNYLIQGSAADQTKQAINDYMVVGKHGTFLATVHDEICISVAPEHLAYETAMLTKAMQNGKFDIPMRATVSIGPNWGDMGDVEKFQEAA